MSVLVTGGAGFVGCNLADRLAAMGETVMILDAMLRPGVARNLEWLRARHGPRIGVTVGDVRDPQGVDALVQRATAVFHFAGQVAVTTSLGDPMEDFTVNALGTLHLLEALRRRGDPVPLLFASTNKVYGDLADVALAVHDGAYQPQDAALRRAGIAETRRLDFHTPYGCSKGAADQYVLDYARAYRIPTVVMRMSCIYGPRQMGTEDQGWVAHFLIRMLGGAPITLFGDGRQVRDVLFVDDAVEAYVRAWQEIDRVAGTAFNLGGGPDNAVSLLRLIAHAERILGRKAEIAFEPWRAGDQRYYVSDTAKIRASLGLAPPLGWQDGVARLLGWLARGRDRGAAETLTLDPIGA